MWKLCFDDSEEFVELYFRLRYTDEVNVAVECDGKVVSALQMLPYPMTFCGKEIPTAYLSGVCTHPDYRNRGMMRALLKKAFGRMWQNGIALSTLIPAEPWLYSCYARSGYARVFRSQEVSSRKLEAGSHILTSGLLNSDFSDNACDFLDRKLRERPCCIQHTPEDFGVILAGLQLEGGKILTWKRDGKLAAVAVVSPVASAEEGEATTLYRIEEWAGDGAVAGLGVADCCNTSGMARIIHAEEVLHRYAAAYPEKECCFRLTDEQLPANNGCYTLRGGVCEKLVGTSATDFPTLTIGELTEEIFLPLSPQMTLMMND